MANNEKKELFLKGHRACAGCGSVLAVRHILKTLGEDIVVVNATGCMEIISSQYPESNWKVPYIHSLFENVPAVATGISRAFKKKGIKTKVVCIAGDGATYDIGFGALSGAMERNEDVLYVCYDNEAYANTGLQRSGATPFGAATTTSPREVGGKSEWKKNLAFIAAAHGIPYAATASIGFLPDFKKKLETAAEMQGFRFVVVLAGCQVGWKHDPSLTIDLARLAVETGIWNLFEVRDGKLLLSREPGKKRVEEYLGLQGRFKHVSKNQVDAIQRHVVLAARELKKLANSGVDLRYLF